MDTQALQQQALKKLALTPDNTHVNVEQIRAVATKESELTELDILQLKTFCSKPARLLKDVVFYGNVTIDPAVTDRKFYRKYENSGWVQRQSSKNK